MNHPSTKFLLVLAVPLLVLSACNRNPEKPDTKKVSEKTQEKESLEPQPIGDFAKVERRTLEEVIPTVGTFKARQTTKISPQVGGRIQFIFVTEGDRVKAGEVLARIDDDIVKLELDQRQADADASRARAVSAKENIESAKRGVASAQQGVASARQGVASVMEMVATAKQGIPAAKAVLSQAKTQEESAALTLNRMKNLWETPSGKEPAIPRSRYDDAIFQHQAAQSAVASAESGVATAQARVSEAEKRVDEAKGKVAEAQSRVAEAMSRVNEAIAREKEAQKGMQQADAAVAMTRQKLRDLDIKAPYTGVITARFVDTGDTVSAGPGTPLFEIQEQGILDLDFLVPQSYLGRIREGDRVQFYLENVEERMGTAPIKTIFPSAEESTRSLRCRATVLNPGLKFKPGLLAQVRITLDKKVNVLSIPRKALTMNQGAWQVTVKTAKGMEPRNISTGLLTEGWAEIRSGLEEGEEVLISEQD